MRQRWKPYNKMRFVGRTMSDGIKIAFDKAPSPTREGCVIDSLGNGTMATRNDVQLRGARQRRPVECGTAVSDTKHGNNSGTSAHVTATNQNRMERDGQWSQRIAPNTMQALGGRLESLFCCGRTKGDNMCGAASPGGKGWVLVLCDSPCKRRPAPSKARHHRIRATLATTTE